jgi:hypothetical protein
VVLLSDTAFEASEPRAALLAGRRWRARLTTAACDAGSVAEVGHGDESGFLLFENVTRPMGCASWLAVFTTGRAMLFLPMETSGCVEWTEAADSCTLTVATSAPQPLPVHLHAIVGLAVRVKADTTRAIRVFGASSRVGVILEFQVVDGTGCPSRPAGGAELTPAGIIMVCYKDVPANTSLALLLGSVLGLATSALPENAMHPDPGARGDHLTLGQAFRINATLRRINAALPPDEQPPDCQAHPERCPALSADAP